ncbi:MAG: hypothetical protein IPF95_10760 [Flavobacteriales bacterium]|nr:hypothetical protein [Flavobacteriales bacterium]MBK6943082.1 hypothetical protein [Flavobacteriales bacterium]MBP6311973.1 hypothetical protein [Flavobacteriales bacterium]
MKAKQLFIALVLVSASSCTDYCKAWGDYKLGSGYSLMAGDGYNQTILILCTSDEKCCYAGIELVPANVSEVAFDDKWIVAKTNTGSETGFWVIEKLDLTHGKPDSLDIEQARQMVTGPLDKTAFDKLTAGESISLTLNKFEWE